MRPLAVLAVALAGAFPLLAGAEAAATTKIVQQRTSDGRILLTDRPVAGATTERSWQVDSEDPVAARRRALDVKAEANLVSERIQRSIEHQRRADLDAERLRIARLDLDRSAVDRDPSVGDATGVVLVAPTRLRGHQRGRFLHDDRGRGNRSPGAMPRSFRGSAAP